MKRYFLFLPFCLLLLVPLGYGVSSEFEALIDWPCYKPTKITFNYAYTHNHSISDISTVGASLYKHSGGPTFIEFIAEDVDSYGFTIILRYNVSTSRNILVGLWSGSEPLKSLTLVAVANVFIIHVRLSLTEQPAYPTEIEVAREVVHQIELSLVQQQEENKKLLEEIQFVTFASSVLGVIAGTTSIIALILAGFTFRRRRELGAV